MTSPTSSYANLSTIGYQVEGDLGFTPRRRTRDSIGGCKIAPLPIKYLCLPLHANPRQKVMWNPLIEKMEEKLATWNIKYIDVWVGFLYINQVIDG